MKEKECVQSAGQTVWKHWKKKNTQQFNHSTIKTGHWVYSTSVSFYLPAPLRLKGLGRCCKAAWGEQGVFLAWRQTDIYAFGAFLHRGRVARLLPFCHSAQQEQKLPLFCSFFFFFAVTKMWKRSSPIVAESKTDTDADEMLPVEVDIIVSYTWKKGKKKSKRYWI